MLGPQPMVPVAPVQVAFVGPELMLISFDYGDGMFAGDPLIAPARYNFPQGGLYRVRVSELPGRPGVELYPTIEIAPPMPRTTAYLAHNTIPVQFTEEDLDQVLTGNFVTKVLYLPDADFAELAVAGVETLVSTRLDPGLDPIVEADRRGSILAIVRIGNRDLEMPQFDGGMIVGAEMPMGPAYPPMVAGATAAGYGMPITGTPIGLPGPPHVPLGSPAGLQKHVMHNHTFVHVPGPTPKLNVHVKHTPGIVYPQQPSRAYIHEHAHMVPWANTQPLRNAAANHRATHGGAQAHAGDCY